MARKLEDYIPVVKMDGIVTDKDATFGGNLTVTGDIALDDITLDEITATGKIVSSSSSAGVGYAAGAGGAVTQATSRATGVTLSKVSGAITTDATSLAAGAEATFTVTNTAVAATDVVVVSMKTITTGTPVAFVTAVAAGSFDITLSNIHASTADTSADVINFAVVKAVAA